MIKLASAVPLFYFPLLRSVAVYLCFLKHCNDQCTNNQNQLDCCKAEAALASLHVCGFLSQQDVCFDECGGKKSQINVRIAKSEIHRKNEAGYCLTHLPPKCRTSYVDQQASSTELKSV